MMENMMEFEDRYPYIKKTLWKAIKTFNKN